MNAGFGICGHKNLFSSGVKIGNYVEDRIGNELAAGSKSQPLQKQTECSANYIDPAAMPDKCAHAPPDNLNERAMLRMGLSYDLIFEHGQPHIRTTTELQRKYTPTSYDIGSGITSKSSGSNAANEAFCSRAKQLELKKAREAREQRHTYVSTNQSIVPVAMRTKKL